MVPAFDLVGNLPPGIHLSTLNEISQRLSHPSYRTRGKLVRALQQYVQDIRIFGPSGIYVDGSFVTQKLAPSDIDIGVVLPAGYDVVGNSWRFKNDTYKRLRLDIQLFGIGWNDEVMQNILAGWQYDRDHSRPKGILYVEINP